MIWSMWLCRLGCWHGALYELCGQASKKPGVSVPLPNVCMLERLWSGANRGPATWRVHKRGQGSDKGRPVAPAYCSALNLCCAAIRLNRESSCVWLL